MPGMVDPENNFYIFYFITCDIATTLHNVIPMRGPFWERDSHPDLIAYER
jgi:hypothetical protein